MQCARKQTSAIMRRSCWLGAIMTVVLSPTLTLAQPGGRGNSTLPLQGKALPVVQAFDSDGQLVSTASLKGSYSVLVFGCLT